MTDSLRKVTSRTTTNGLTEALRECTDRVVPGFIAVATITTGTRSARSWAQVV